MSFEERLNTLEQALDQRDGLINKLEDLAKKQAKQMDDMRKSKNPSRFLISKLLGLSPIIIKSASS